MAAAGRARTARTLVRVFTSRTLRHRGASMCRLVSWQELEDRSALRGFLGIANIDAVEHAHERDAEGDAPSERPKRVAEEAEALDGAQLDRSDGLLTATDDEPRLTRGSQVPDPMDVTPRRPYPASAVDLDDGQ